MDPTTAPVVLRGPLTQLASSQWRLLCRLVVLPPQPQCRRTSIISLGLETHSKRKQTMPHSRVFVVYPPSVTLLRCAPSISHTSHYNPANNSKKNDFTMSPLLTSSSTISQRSLSHSTVPCRSLRGKHGVRSSNVEDGGSRAAVWCFCTSL